MVIQKLSVIEAIDFTKSAQKGVTDFNYFLLQEVNPIIEKIINVMLSL